MFCVSPGIRSLLATLITFLVNTSWSTPTTDADGALDFVSGLRLHLRFGSAISGLRAVRSTLTGPQLCWLRYLGLHLAWFAPSPFKVYTYRGPRLFWSLLFCVSSGLRYPTLIMFLVNTSLSMPTTDADGALGFVAGLHLHLHCRSAISGLCALRSTLTVLDSVGLQRSEPLDPILEHSAQAPSLRAWPRP